MTHHALAGFEGAVTISRGDYGVTWNAALETGRVLVSDKIVLESRRPRSRTPDPRPVRGPHGYVTCTG
jgi:hypothetical protein